MENQGQRMSSRRLLPKPRGNLTVLPPPEPTVPRHREKVKRACERCRRRKSRCDGGDPSCASCLLSHTECVYRMPPKVLKRRFEELEVAYRDVTQNLKKMNSKDRIVADQSPDAGDEPRAYSSSARAVSSPDASYTGYDRDDWRRRSSSVSHVYLPLSQWTTVSKDEVLLNHLFTFFWTWEATLTRVLHRELLIHSLLLRRATKDGVSSEPEDASEAPFCSELLINAILAISLAGFFKASEDSALPTHRAFANEATQLLELHDRGPRLPLLQGIAILSAYEQAFGSTSRGATLYFDTLAALRTSNMFDILSDDSSSSSDDSFEQAVSYIADGFHHLDAKTSLVLDRLDYVSPPSSNTYNGLSTLHNTNGTGALWAAFPVSTQPRIAHYGEQVRAEKELDGVAADVLLAIRDGRESPVPDYVRAKELYHALLQWKGSRSEFFHGPTSLIPAWMCLLSYFHLLAIKLLSAFTGLSFLDFTDGKTARYLSQSHSEGVISSLWNFYTAYGMRHDLWLLRPCHAAVETLLFDNTLPGIHEQSLSRGCELLYLMGQYMTEANGLNLAIWNEALDKKVKWPTVGKRFLKASLVNVRRTSIVNASPLLLGDAGVGEPLPHSHRVSFTRTVESLEDVEDQ